MGKLPKDVVEIITSLLNLYDYISSSLVCKSWRSLLLQSDILRPQIPWLMLPHYSTSHHIKFCNLLEKKYHTFMLPEGVDGRKVVGCSKGWVIFMTKCTFEISLFNPIFGVKYHLPPLLPMTTLSLQRVELSSPNISDCTVAAILDNFGKLVLCKLKDERWEVVLPVASGGVQRVDRTLIDILFCRQKLHVLVKSENGDEKIENLVVKLPNSGEVVSITLIHYLNYKNNDDLVEVERLSPSTRFNVFSRYLHISYLVESTKGRVMVIQKQHCSLHIIGSEQVNMIHQYFDIINDNENRDDDEEEEEEDNNNSNKEEEVNLTALKHILYNLEGFMIYEIEDLASKKMVSKGLGKEQALFLSSKSRLCLPRNASNNNRLQGNSIHFIMDRSKVTDGLGVYHHDDFTAQPLNPKFHYLWKPKFMWFAPNLTK